MPTVPTPPPRPSSAGREPREVHSISTLPPSAREDRDRRMQRYLVSMTTRTVCFLVAAGVTIVHGPAWIAWVCVVAAVLLPYPAVVAANNINRRREVVPARHHTPRELPRRDSGGLSPGSPLHDDDRHDDQDDDRYDVRYDEFDDDPGGGPRGADRW